MKTKNIYKVNLMAKTCFFTTKNNFKIQNSGPTLKPNKDIHKKQDKIFLIKIGK